LKGTPASCEGGKNFLRDQMIQYAIQEKDPFGRQSGRGFDRNTVLSNASEEAYARHIKVSGS